MDKITEITPEQKAKMPLYVDKWTKIGRSTAPMDFEKACELVIATYDKINREQKWDNERPHITRSRIIACPSPILAQQAGRQVAREMGFKDGEADGYWPAQIYGSSAARFDFILNELGVLARLNESQRQAWEILEPFTQVCGGVYFAPDFAIVADRPAVLKLMQLGNTYVLHCVDGPAIAWGRDENGNYDPNHKYGDALFYWQGTEVPRNWIMEKPVTDAEKKARAIEVLKEPNADRRTAGAEILGWAEIISALDPRLIDEHPNPMFGKLVEVDFPVGNGSETEATRFLVAQCGTGRTIAIPALPEARTALEAGAMSYRLSTEEYQKLKIRT